MVRIPGLDRATLRETFLEVHEGRAPEAVLASDRLRHCFLRECREQVPGYAEPSYLWGLLSLRPSAQLGPIETPRTHFDHTAYVHAAEIAGRRLQDAHLTSVAAILGDPMLRALFDVEAAELAPGVEPERLRLALLSARRRGRHPVDGAASGRGLEQPRFTLAEVRRDTSALPARPGLYVVGRTDGVGARWLYAGEAGDLRTVVARQLDRAEPSSLARHLWDEGADGAIEVHVLHRPGDAGLDRRTVRESVQDALVAELDTRWNLAADF